MDTARICQHCGKPLTSKAVHGLCPECFFKAGLGSGVGPEGAAPKSGGFTPPAPEELAPHFPRLEILELLGQGGMGAVYKARQKGLDRLVALKVLPPDSGGDPAFAERFTREAQALARLNHPGIVGVHEFGQAGGLYFFVMEFVDGVNLRQMLRAHRLSPREAMIIVPQICEALQFAHDHAIVHRDIKPENVLVDKAGRVKIADFGLAKLLGREQGGEPLTRPAHVMGTPQYMAPEQLEKPLEVDHRADIYSLGVVFYEMLTGELPLGRFASPSRKVEVDVRLDEIVLRALEKEPALRYQQASVMKTEVETVAGGAPLPKRKGSAAPPSLFARLALGLFLTALLGTPLLLALSRREEPSVFFGVIALLLALGFSIASWRERLGRIVAIAILTLMGISCLSAIFFHFNFGFRRNEAVTRRAEMESTERQLENAIRKAETERTLTPGSLIRDSSTPTSDLNGRDWRQAFAIGQQWAALPPDEGFSTLRENWAAITNVEARQQLLKAFAFAHHERLPAVLELGLLDPSPQVQSWALQYLKEIALRDFSADYDYARAWLAAQRRGETPAGTLQVLTEPEFMAIEKSRRITTGRIYYDPQSPLQEIVGEYYKADATGRPMTNAPTVAFRAKVRLTEAMEEELYTTGKFEPHESSQLIGQEKTLAGILQDSARQAAVTLGHTDPGEVRAQLEILDRSGSLLEKFPAGADPDLGRALAELAGSNDTDVARMALMAARHTHFEEDWFRRVALPRLDRTNAWPVRLAAAAALGHPGRDWAVTPLLGALDDTLGSQHGAIPGLAQALAEIGSPRAIPGMIAVIDADNTYDTVYGVGYFGLHELTGVDYDAKHDGAWWREWWEHNKSRYSADVQALRIARLESVASNTAPRAAIPLPDDLAGVPVVERFAGGDTNKFYFLINRSGNRAPDNNTERPLLLVLPGGDGGRDFNPFVRRICLEALPQNFLVAELVAPKWDDQQFEQLVWPVKKNPYPAMKFTTEALVAAVIADLEREHRLDPRRIFTLSWSSGGPAAYAVSLDPQSRVTGSFIAMSVFRPEQLPDLKAARGRSYFLLHSPEDFIPFRMAEQSRDLLTTNGAAVRLESYAGGHGWHGEVMNTIRRGIQWLEQSAAAMPAPESTGAIIERLVRSVPPLTGYKFEIWEKVPGAAGEYRIRRGIRRIALADLDPAPPGLPSGEVFFIAATNRFYIQWDLPGASTLHYYGPFAGDPSKVLRLPSPSPEELSRELLARFEAAKSINGIRQRDEAMTMIAGDAARAGDPVLARKILDQITMFPTRDDAVLAAARELLKNGHRREAIAIAQSITSFTKRDDALRELAE